MFISLVRRIFSELHKLLISALSVYASIGSYLDYAVSCSLEYLVVVRCKENYSLEVYKAVIYSSDAFKVKVIGGTVKQENIRAKEHHA